MGEQASEEKVILRLIDQKGKEYMFKLKRSSQMGRVKIHYAEKEGAKFRDIRIMHGGRRVDDSSTPDELNLKNNDRLEAFFEQRGG